MRRSRLFISILTAATTLICTGRAEAASFQVDPSTFVLSATATSGQLAIRNLGVETVRIQVSAFIWKQTPGGDIDLAPTKDLVFFPSILTIAPRDSRNVRISPASPGILATTTVEKTYRLIVEELAPIVKLSSPNAVRVLIRMSIPVFMQPATLRPVPRVQNLAVQKTNATFQVANPGTSHFITKKVRLTVTSSNGRKLFDSTIGGWYVLAQGMRAYEVALPPAACATGASVTVEVETDKGKAVEHVKSACITSSL